MINRFWTDDDGYDSIWFDKDAREEFKVDWQRRLPSGVTISSAAVKGDGINVESSVVDPTSVRFTISGTVNGKFSKVVTLATYSDTQVKSHTVRVYPREM